MLTNARAVVLRSHRPSRVLAIGIVPWMALPTRSYDRVAGVYDLLGDVWSGGAIRRAGAAAASMIDPGQSVLVAGVGGGRDAAALARVGAHLTLVDLSPRMLALAAARVRAEGRAADVQQADVLTWPGQGAYDLVCAHYFLNVFGPDAMPEALGRLCAHVRVGGLLSVADFAPLAGGLASRSLQRAHFGVPLAVFRLLGLCADHPIYDYASVLPPGFAVESVLDHRVFGLGPRGHRSWCARRLS